MGKLGHLLDLCQYFTHGVSSVSNSIHSRSLRYGPLLWNQTKPICHVNSDFKSESGMYA